MIKVLLMLGISLFFSACGGDSSSVTVPDAPAIYDVTGNWSHVQSVDASGCGNGFYTQTDTFTATQTGNNVVFTNLASGLTFTATANGATYSTTATYPDTGGTVTEHGTLVFSSANSATSSSTATWSGGGFSCVITATGTVTRI